MRNRYKKGDKLKIKMDYQANYRYFLVEVIGCYDDGITGNYSLYGYGKKESKGYLYGSKGYLYGFFPSKSIKWIKEGK